MIDEYTPLSDTAQTISKMLVKSGARIYQTGQKTAQDETRIYYTLQWLVEHIEAIENKMQPTTIFEKSISEAAAQLQNYFPDITTQEAADELLSEVLLKVHKKHRSDLDLLSIENYQRNGLSQYFTELGRRELLHITHTILNSSNVKLTNLQAQESAIKQKLISFGETPDSAQKIVDAVYLASM